MRHSVLITASSLALLLAACQGGQPSAESADAATESVAMVEPRVAEAAAPGQAQRTGGGNAVPEAQVPQLAYSYRYTLEAPARAVPDLAARHEQACVSAGPALCQVVGLSVQRTGDDRQSGQLEIRATPQWLTTFRNGLSGEVEAANGRIADQATETEDLTRALVDTEAHLNAKRALRDRIQAMLQTRAGDLQTALQVEQELARVQAEIDSAQSQLAVMRARVQMSRLTIAYESRGTVAPDSAFTPVRAAFESALSIVMYGVAAIVTIVAVALPFAVVIGPIVWFWLRRRRKAKPPTQS